MRYIDLSKPHGFLIWKGKQKAIVSPELLPTGEKMLIVQEGQEAYGEVVLGNPSQINLTEFERLEEEHTTRPEERKLKWPDTKSFYMYRFKEWQPFEESQEVELDNGHAQLIPQPVLTEAEKQLLEQAERLPKTLILRDDAVKIEDNQVIFCEGLDGSKVMPILSATFDNKEVADILPLYQLALVRLPKLRLKKNITEATMNEDEKAEGTKPYKIMSEHEDCEGHAVVKVADGEMMSCHDTMEEAMTEMATMMEEEKGGRGSGRRRGSNTTESNKPKKPKKAGSGYKEQLAEIVEELAELIEEDDKEVSLDQELQNIRDAFYKKYQPNDAVKANSPYTWVQTIFKGYVIAQVGEKLFKATYSTDEDGNIQFADKNKWQQVEVSYTPTGTTGVKALATFEDDTKEMSLDGQSRIVRDAFVTTYNPQVKKEVAEYKPMPWVREVYDDYVICSWGNKLYKANYSTDENSKIKFADKSKWIEMEYMMMPTGNVGAKGMWEGFEEAVKERSFSDWLDEYYELSDKSAIELTEEEAVKAVWSTAFVNKLPDSSFLYIKPDCGEKDEDGMTKPRSCRMFPYKAANGEIDMPHLRNAIARAPQANLPEEVKNKIQKRAQSLLAEQDGEKAGRKIRGTMMERVKKAWEALKEVMDWAADPEEEEDIKEIDLLSLLEGESAIGIKKVDGKWWYVTYSTNAFKDREKEIFSTKSLEQYVTQAEKSGDRGHFNLWHIGTKENPSLTDFARKEWQGVAGRFLIEAGPFLDDKKGQAALKFFKEYSRGHPELAPEGWGCSPEYKYLPEEREKGIYENIWITRTSTLPKMAAANIWTNGGITMALTAEQKKSLETIFGEKEAKDIISVAETKTKELEEAGVGHKSVEEEVPTVEVIVEQVAQKMTTDFAPIQALLQEIATKQKGLEEELVNLKTEVQGAKSEEARKAKDDSPKYVWSLVERASEASKTIVPEGDPLLEKKPLETPVKGGAAAFFKR